MSLVKLRSNPIPYAVGRQPFQLNTLPRRGPRNGRLALEKAWVEIAITVTTPGGVTVVPRDTPTLLKLVEFRDAAGPRRNMAGIEAMIWAQHFLERRCNDLIATIPAAAGTAVSVRIPIPFRYDSHSFDLRDYALPTDDLLDGGQVALTMPAVSDIVGTGGAITSLTAGTYTMLFELREDTDVQAYCRDVIDSAVQPTQTGIDLFVGDNMLCDLLLRTAGTAGGGVSQANLVDVTIPSYRMDALTRAQLKETYLAEHDAPRVLADGYVYNDVCTPIISAQRDSKWKDHSRVEGSLQGRLTNTVAAGTWLYRVQTPQDARMLASAAAANDLRNPAATVKTAGKSSKGTKGWGALGAFARKKLFGQKAA